MRQGLRGGGLANEEWAKLLKEVVKLVIPDV